VPAGFVMSGVAVGSMGELLVEFVCAERDSHNRRPASYSGPFPSGAPGIFIDQAARIGARTIFAGAVGTDAFGGVLLDRLKASGVTLDLVRRIADRPTGTAMVAYNGDGSRDFVFNIAQSAAPLFGDAAAILARLRDFQLDVFHISGSSLADPRMAQAILSVAEALHDEGVKISFDPNVRKELAEDAATLAAVRRLTAISRYFLPSEEDLAVLFPGQRFEAVAETLFQQATELAVLKRGGGGCRAITRNGEMAELAGHKVRVIDPTGAGDCFCATFVSLIASGKQDLHAALARANAAGALAVMQLGPMEGNAALEAVERFLEHPVELAS
jgi:sugar/nucleoside kinase (ribokinase family)